MGWATARAIGDYGERLAVRFLRERGFDVLDMNWRCDLGEVDIVAREGRCLVVCEVKTRRSAAYGAPIEAVSYHKLARLRRLAAVWIREQRSAGRVLDVDTVRVDVIGVLRPRTGPGEVEHIVGALT